MPKTLTPAFLAGSLLVLSAGGCATHLTVGDFLNRKFVPDEKLRAINAAAEAACQAYDYQAKTGIGDVDDAFTEQLTTLVNTAQDKWRLQTTVRVSELSATLPVEGDVELKDLGKPEYFVPLGGTACITYRVRATQSYVTVVGISTGGGVPILSFDNRLNPMVDAEFSDYLRGDKISVKGNARFNIDRGGKLLKRQSAFGGQFDGAQPTPSDPSSEAVAGGCNKDTDCKGKRICEKGQCVNP